MRRTIFERNAEVCFFFGRPRVSGCFLGKKKKKLEFSAQGIKPFVWILICVSMIVIKMACKKINLSGHQVLCCRNGSAVLGENIEWIWMKKWTPTCGPEEPVMHAQILSDVCLIAIVMGTVACIACHVYYAAGYPLYQLFRSF